jgi:hypothetical protein
MHAHTHARTHARCASRVGADVARTRLRAHERHGSVLGELGRNVSSAQFGRVLSEAEEAASGVSDNDLKRLKYGVTNTTGGLLEADAAARFVAGALACEERVWHAACAMALRSVFEGVRGADARWRARAGGAAQPCRRAAPQRRWRRSRTRSRRVFAPRA